MATMEPIVSSTRSSKRHRQSAQRCRGDQIVELRLIRQRTNEKGARFAVEACILHTSPLGRDKRASPEKRVCLQGCLHPEEGAENLAICKWPS